MKILKRIPFQEENAPVQETGDVKNQFLELLKSKSKKEDADKA